MITFKIQGKNSEHFICRLLFPSNCVISLVQKQHAYEVGQERGCYEN